MTTVTPVRYTLSPVARNVIRFWRPDEGLTIAGYVRHFFPGGRWGGDVCGCHDDRCVGYHHDADEDCGCLPVMLGEYETAHMQTRRAAGAAAVGY